MRKDMAKVIVERPRRKRDAEIMVKGRNANVSLSDLPFYEGMRACRRRRGSLKELNENFTPLIRYLKSQAGRPWNDVFSEICEHINPNHTLQQHVLGHVLQFVEMHTYRVNGSICDYRGYPIGYGDGLYVDPTGLLCDGGKYKNSHVPEKRDDYIFLSPERGFQRLDGVWFEIFYTIVPDVIEKRWIDENGKERVHRYRPSYEHLDVVARKWASPHFYVRGKHIARFAHRKRQLTSRELKQHGLVNQDYSVAH